VFARGIQTCSREAQPWRYVPIQHGLELIPSFTVRCLPSINFFDPLEPDFNADSIRDKSPLLFWAVVATGARETPELYDTFLSAQENTMELLRQTLGGPRANYWDLCGAMVWNKWLAPVRPIGGIGESRRYEHS